MFQIGETARMKITLPVALDDDGLTYFRAGDLVRIDDRTAAGTTLYLTNADGVSVWASAQVVKPDATLPLFDEYRPQTTGSLF